MEGRYLSLILNRVTPGRLLYLLEHSASRRLVYITSTPQKLPGLVVKCSPSGTISAGAEEMNSPLGILLGTTHPVISPGRIRLFSVRSVESITMKVI